MGFFEYAELEKLGKNYAVITHKTLEKGLPLQDDVVYILVTTMDKAKEHIDTINNNDNIYFSPAEQTRIDRMVNWFKEWRADKNVVPCDLVICKINRTE